MRAVEASSGTPTAAGGGADDDGRMVFLSVCVEECERGAAVFFLDFGLRPLLLSSVCTLQICRNIETDFSLLFTKVSDALSDCELMRA